MICGYVRGGRQCGRPARAAVTLVVPGHENHPPARVLRLCLDHVLAVVETQGHSDTYDGASTLIAWGLGVSEPAGE